MIPTIEVDSIGVVLGGQHVLHDLSLTLGPGGSLAVEGPNGSGKTTLLRLLATLVRPTSGRGTVLGSDLTAPEIRAIRGRIGLITHAPALIDDLTIAENLRHFAILAGRDPDECARALDVVGLAKAAQRRAGEASFGMKRRSEIAWLLLAKPDLLLLDEAKSGLDVEARELIDAIVALTLARSGIVVAVSHQVSLLDAAFDRSMRLSSGRLEELT